MSDDSSRYSDPRTRWIALVLIGIAVAVAGTPPLVYALFGDSVKLWNMSIIGAIGLFAASRLGFWWAVGFMGLAIGLKDLGFYYTRGYRADLFSLPCFVLYGAIGWASLRHAHSPIRIGAGALSASILFFLVSNFTCWLDPKMSYERSLSGLAMCYEMAIPFFRGTLVGDLVYAGALFGAYAALCRVYFPARRPVAIEAKQDGGW